MSSNVPLAGLILAAGKGTRMKSDLPKALFRVCGVPMVELVGRAMKAAGVERPVIIVGHAADQVRDALGDSYEFAMQSEQRGTGHAASMAQDLLASHRGAVLVAPGDSPLLTAEALKAVYCHHLDSGAQATLATCRLSQPLGYGRVIRESGRIMRVVEEKDATPEERLIGEVNAGIYCFETQVLLRMLPELSDANAQGEYYLTDVIEKISMANGLIEAVELDTETVMGVNDRWQLAEAEALLRKRTLKAHALNGVTIVDPITTYIGMDVVIEADAEILPMTTIEGRTSIARGAAVGPGCRVIDAEIGEGCQVLLSHVNGAIMKAGSKCGPFANLRPGAVLGEGAKVGNFVEVKKATLGPGAAASHLTYLGDATIGANTNIGAGTITCNYDGFSKHKTVIGENAFVGSNSTLVAPVTIGDGAIIAAGSVVTVDVPADALALGRSRQENKEEWAPRWRERKRTP
jgi:bifunctional UDP-N-acetylglucosamine pyrophosphorylase/glucosamine-1-phosphate N-acetyltransferase